MMKERLTNEPFLRGYDLDGVLDRGIKPIAPFVVISGRRLDTWNMTINDVQEVLGYLPPLYLRPYEDKTNSFWSAKWKIEMIQKLDVREFYEDNPMQAEMIRKECLYCRVILVE